VTDVCRWWKITHRKLPLKYNGTHYQAGVECTKPIWCKYNITDEKAGGCVLGGDLTDTPEEDRP